MRNRFRSQCSRRVVPALLLALAVSVGAPQAALAQDGYITLGGASGKVLVYDPANPTAISNIFAVAILPIGGVAMSPDGTTAYVVVANRFVYRIVGGVLDATPVTASLNGLPEQITVSPDGTRSATTARCTSSTWRPERW